MNYTITHMENYDGTQRLNLDQDGNRYLVGHYDKLTKKYTHKKFATLDEAEAAFLKIAKCFIRCDYSAEDRAKMLLEA